MTSTAEGGGSDGAPGDETLFDDTAERTAMSSRRREAAPVPAAPAAVASESAADDADERTALSSRRRATTASGATADAGEETAPDDPLDSTIVVHRGTTRIDDDTIRATRATPAPRTASTPDRATHVSGRTASAPATGRVAHAPAVGAERYPRRAVPVDGSASGDDAGRPRAAAPGIPPRSYGEGPTIDRAIRSTARRRAVILGAAILLALGSAAVVLIVLLGGGAA